MKTQICRRKSLAISQRWIAAQHLPNDCRILEIGCGTGFLGAALVDRLCDAQWLMTDIAPAMVARTSARFVDDRRVRVAVMDGEHPQGEESYDLICSSLAMQWFGDLSSPIGRLRARLAPGGLLAFTTLTESSFAEWRAANHGNVVGTHDYPSRAALEAMGLKVEVADHAIHYKSARHFLKTLKDIGAGTPQPRYRPLSPRTLKRVMAHFESTGSVATYAVATCMVRADG